MPISTLTDSARIALATLKHNLAKLLISKPTKTLIRFIQKKENEAALALLRIERNLELDNRLDAFNNTLLHWAVYMQDLELVQALLAAGANPNLLNNDEKTPLYLAFTNHDEFKPVNLQIAAALCSNVHIDLNIQNTKTKETVLHWAVRTGQIDIAEKLIQIFHADPYRQNADNLPPLYLAIEKGNTAMVHIMLRSDVDPNYCHDNLSLPPLHWAQLNREHVIARLLELYGANPKTLSKHGDTAADLAAYYTPQPIPGTLPSVGIVNRDHRVEYLTPWVQPLMSSAYKPTQPVPTHLAAVGVVNSSVLTIGLNTQDLTRKHP